MVDRLDGTRTHSAMKINRRKKNVTLRSNNLPTLYSNKLTRIV